MLSIAPLSSNKSPCRARWAAFQYLSSFSFLSPTAFHLDLPFDRCDPTVDKGGETSYNDPSNEGSVVRYKNLEIGNL